MGENLRRVDEEPISLESIESLNLGQEEFILPVVDSESSSQESSQENETNKIRVIYENCVEQSEFRIIDLEKRLKFHF